MMRLICVLCAILSFGGCCRHCCGEESPRSDSGIVSIKNINKVCSDEVYKNEKLKSEYSRILLRYKKTSGISSNDARLRHSLELKTAIQGLVRDLLDAQESQVQLLMMIDQIGKGRELLAQEVPYVLSNRNKVSRLGKNQQVMLTVLRRLSNNINRDIRRMPLPKQYVNQFGSTMKLISPPKKPPFYISIVPLSKKNLPAAAVAIQPGALESDAPVTNITYRQAVKICQLMQMEEEGIDYRLPDCDELQAAAGAGMAVPLAVWTRSPWSKDWKEEECCKRFGVTMMTVWDPGCVMNKVPGGGFFQELPAASYDHLGMLVVSSGKSGFYSRFRKIRAAMEQEDGR